MIANKNIKNNILFFNSGTVLRNINFPVFFLLFIRKKKTYIEQIIIKIKKKNNITNKKYFFTKNKKKMVFFKYVINFFKKNYECISTTIHKINIYIPNQMPKKTIDGLYKKNNITLETMGKCIFFKDMICKNNKILYTGITVKAVRRQFLITQDIFCDFIQVLSTFFINNNKFLNYKNLMLPLLVPEKMMFMSCHLPKFNMQAFKLPVYRLIPTSEVSVINLMQKKIFNIKELPVRYTCFSQCFRSEMYSNCKVTKLKQFSKVELISITTPLHCRRELHILLLVVKRILSKIRLPYRLHVLCAKDISFCSKKTYDIDVWMPLNNFYLEISSCSECDAFQSRRLSNKYIYNNAKYNTNTLNGSSLPIERVMIAILENYRDYNSNILIPGKLQLLFKYKRIIFISIL